MGRRIRRGLRPDLELFERRELLSAITAVMAASSIHTGNPARGAGTLLAGGGGGGGAAGGGGGAASSNFASSIRLDGSTLNQGPLLNPDGSVNNMALAPTGNPKPGQLRRERFTAQFVGPYSVIPGRTSTQAIQTRIQGAGTATTILHGDIQILLVTPSDGTLPIGGVLTIFDRNLNSNTTLGLDLSASQQDVDRGGRPNHIPIVTSDANISSGVYVESYTQGVVNIRYIPGGRPTIPGAISQGTAIVTIHAHIYTANTSFILRNANLDP